MVKSLGGIVVIILMLTSCASNEALHFKLEAIDSRPYIADSITLPTYSKTELQPLEKFTDLSKENLIIIDEQRRADRNTARELDKALEKRATVNEQLLTITRLLEQESRAHERISARLEDTLDKERDSAFWNEVKHKAMELGLLTLVVILAL